MSSDQERLERAKRREAKRIDIEAQDAEKGPKAQIARKKLEEAVATKRKSTMGDKILSAKLTYEETAVLFGSVSCSDLTSAVRESLHDFTMHVVREARSLKPAAVEFSQTTK